MKHIQQHMPQHPNWEALFIKAYFQNKNPSSAQLSLMIEIFEKADNSESFIRFMEDLRRNKSIHIVPYVMN